MPIDVDEPRPQVPDSPQGQLQEVFGCDSITVGREHELDGVAF
jgi:hypothetical protein